MKQIIKHHIQSYPPGTFDGMPDEQIYIHYLEKTLKLSQDDNAGKIGDMNKEIKQLKTEINSLKKFIKEHDIKW